MVEHPRDEAKTRATKLRTARGLAAFWEKAADQAVRDGDPKLVMAAWWKAQAARVEVRRLDPQSPDGPADGFHPRLAEAAERAKAKEGGSPAAGPYPSDQRQAARKVVPHPDHMPKPAATRRRHELGDSQWSDRATAQPAWGAAGQRRMDNGGGAVSDIQSMRDDFPATVHRAQQAVQDAVAEVRRAMAAVDGSPSHQAVKDAAGEWVTGLSAFAGKGEEIHALSRQADASRWDVADNPRPGDSAWTR